MGLGGGPNFRKKKDGGDSPRERHKLKPIGYAGNIDDMGTRSRLEVTDRDDGDNLVTLIETKRARSHGTRGAGCRRLPSGATGNAEDPIPDSNFVAAGLLV